MTNYAWFALLVRAIGLLLIGWTLPYVLSPIQTIALLFESGQFGLPLSSKIAQVAYSLGFIVQLIFGIYLFLGGKRIVMRCISAVDGHCAACGYDLRGLKTTTCPECGLETGPGDSGVNSPNTPKATES